jgi:hypothetical protein
MQKWEYLVLSYLILGKYMVNGMEKLAFKNMGTATVLNELGKEGWELVLQDKDKEWIFKRPKS